MKILLLTDGVQPYRMGGMPRQCLHLSRNLPLLGAELTVLHCVPEGYPMVSKEEFQRMVFPGDEANVDSICIPFPKNHKFPGHYIYESKLFSKWAFEAVKDRLHTFDFIYAKGFTAYHFLKNKNKNFPPIFVQLHGLEMFQKTWDLKSQLQMYILQPIAKYCLKNADFIFSYAGSIEQKTIEIGVKPERIFHQYGCVPSEKLVAKIRNTGSVKRFVFTPRYERRKGIPEFHEAVKSLLDTEANFQVDIIGPVPENERIKHPKLVYHGQVNSEEQYYSIVSECDIVLLPSISEGFPLVTLEAMARGLTAIANNVGAVSVLVTNKNGWLIEPTVEALCNAMREAIHSPLEVLDAKKEKALQSVKNQFVWPIQCASILRHAESALKIWKQTASTYA